MWTRLTGYAALGIALALLAFVLYRNSEKANEVLVFSPPQIMNALWADYKDHFLEEETLRALDPSRDNITTSEGQSYTMLRAVWMGDKETFDTVWQWTKDNLMHDNDKLFAWLYGKREDGSYGVLTQESGETSASDAEVDIAVALVFAYARWQDVRYLHDARALINDIWEYEVVDVGGTYYLAANNIEKGERDDWILINPSYFHPAAYRIFAQVDGTHPWASLTPASYSLLETSASLPLERGTSAGLPPDWIEINRQSGVLRAATSPLTTNFGYDALRVPWRIALDYQWFAEPRAQALLRKFEFLGKEWQTHEMLASTYTHDGEIVHAGETPAMYGGTIGYFMITDPATAKEIYEKKLAFLFSPGSNTWKERLPYYDDNWSWFGLGLYYQLLPNLTAGLPENSLKQL